MKVLLVLNLIATIAVVAGVGYFAKTYLGFLDGLTKELSLAKIKLTEANENIKAVGYHTTEQFCTLSDEVAKVGNEMISQHQSMATADEAMHDETLKLMAVAIANYDNAAADLREQSRLVKVHAQAIIDARLQHDTNPQVARAVCSECKRPVWKFEIKDDKVICGDCSLRPVPAPPAPLKKRSLISG